MRIAINLGITVNLHLVINIIQPTANLQISIQLRIAIHTNKAGNRQHTTHLCTIIKKAVITNTGTIINMILAKTYSSSVKHIAPILYFTQQSPS